MGGIDVVLDDGSHIGRHQRTSFDVLFPLLQDGGHYIIEDMHTAYWPVFEGGLKRKGTADEFLKDKLDEIHKHYIYSGLNNAQSMSDIESIQFSIRLQLSIKESSFQDFWSRFHQEETRRTFRHLATMASKTIIVGASYIRFVIALLFWMDNPPYHRLASHRQEVVPRVSAERFEEARHLMTKRFRETSKLFLEKVFLVNYRLLKANCRGLGHFRTLAPRAKKRGEETPPILRNMYPSDIVVAPKSNALTSETKKFAPTK